jgi:hypothetical protein
LRYTALLYDCYSKTATMITKPWTPPPPQAPEDREVQYPLDLPCLMSGAGLPFIGPEPLMLCLLQGLRLARMRSRFEIKTEEGDRILELRDGKVWGVPSLVDIFVRSGELADSLFHEMLVEARKAVSPGQQ